MFVKPAEGRTVRRPDTFTLLPSEGADVVSDEFWVRRLRDGDVVTADGPADTEAAPLFFEIGKQLPPLDTPVEEAQS